MSKTKLQFHATTKDIFEFVINLVQNRSYTACGVIFTPHFKLEEIAINTGISDFKRYDMIVVSKGTIIYYDNYSEFICKQDNNLGITVGCNANDKLKESSMWVYAEYEIDDDWKKIISNYKKSLLKGAWVVNPITKVRNYHKNHRYTTNAKLAYENGALICPIAGWNIYELGSV